MRVRVEADACVAVGDVAVEDRYNSEGIVEIAIKFNPGDVDASCLDELSDSLTIQAIKWMPRYEATPEQWQRVEVRVIRDRRMPPGINLLIDGDEAYSEYRFSMTAIKPKAAEAFRRMIQSRSDTWTRVG